MSAPRDNPFRVDRVSAIAFQMDPERPEQDPNRLADRFIALRQGAIVGPHGSGKSTLLRAIADTLTARGVAVLHASLPGSANRAQRTDLIRNVTTAINAHLLIDRVALLDGYEQLSILERATIRRGCPRLLVTAHRPGAWCLGLKTLAALRPTCATLDRVLAKLVDPVPPAVAAAAHAAFARRHGNVRETLFDLYDQWPAAR